MSAARTALAVVVVVVAAALRMRPIYSLDLWWHLSMGRAVRAAGARTVAEPVAFAGPETYVDPEWLFDLVALTVFEAAGPAGIVVATALLAAGSALAVHATARAAGAGRWGAVLLTALVVAATSFRFLPRPQSAFLVMLPVATWAAIVVRRRTGRARWIAVVGLHVLLAVWAQTHSSIAVAPVVAIALALLPWPGAPALSPGIVLAVLALGVWPFTGAHGLGIIDQVLRHSGGDATRYITDMKPMGLADWIPVASPSLLVTELLLAAGAGLAAWRRRLAPGALVGVLLGIAMTATANRFRAALALLAVPWVAGGLAGVAVPAWAAWGAVAVLPTILLLSAGQLGVGVDRTMVATDLADALEARGVTGRIFAEYDHGGLLGWRLAPDLRVFLDGRTPVHFDADDLWAYRRGVRDPTVLRALHAAHDLDAVSVYRFRPVCEALVADPAWVPVWADARTVLFLPEGTPVEAPCLPPVDPTPRADDVAIPDDAVEARRLASRLGHEAPPGLDAAVARACADAGDVGCAASHGWRAALAGSGDARAVLGAIRDDADAAAQRRIDVLLGAQGR